MTNIVSIHHVFVPFVFTITMLPANPNYVTVSRNCASPCSPTSEYFRRQTSKPFFLSFFLYADAWKRGTCSKCSSRRPDAFSDFRYDKYNLSSNLSFVHFISITLSSSSSLLLLLLLHANRLRDLLIRIIKRAKKNCARKGK